jgi:hypothetical protein
MTAPTEDQRASNTETSLLPLLAVGEFQRAFGPL